MKILFIAGWVNVGEDDYIDIDYLRDDTTYFPYSITETMASIENRLLRVFNVYNYDRIRANSMGAFLSSRFLAKCLNKQNVLLISPYIQTSFSRKNHGRNTLFISTYMDFYRQYGF